MKINSSVITTILVVVLLVAIGFIALGYVADITPEIIPDYGRTFDNGTAPFNYNTGTSHLDNIVVTKYNFSAVAWQAVATANVSYSGNIVTVATVEIPLTNISLIRIVGEYRIDETGTWVTIAGLVVLIIVVVLLMLVVKSTKFNK